MSIYKDILAYVYDLIIPKIKITPRNFHCEYHFNLHEVNIVFIKINFIYLLGNECQIQL